MTERWVHVEGAGVRGPRGWAFRGVSLSADRGGLHLVTGRAGGGRTSLLLALAGRMRLTEGRGTIAGAELPRELHRVQRLTALGAMRAVNELEPDLTVAEHVREALGIRAFLGASPRKVAAVLARTGLDVDPDELVYRLSPADRQLLGLTLALTGYPEVVFLDDVDAGLDPDDQHALWTRLSKIVDEQELTVVASCHHPAPAEGLAAVLADLAPVAA